MLYTYPDYWKEFECKAAKCQDTCCAGWQIVVDEAALQDYRRVRGIFKIRMKRSVNWAEKTFRQDENRRCAFLNEENLCDLYIKLGKNSLCKTCRTYPKHVEEFENVREISLSLSCPEVARILMSKCDPVHFLSKEKPAQEEYEDFDPFLYSKLLDARDVMIKLLQERDMPIEMRACLVLGMAHDIQARVDRGELFTCDTVLERYQSEKARFYVGKLVTLWRERPQQQYAFATGNFVSLYQLERLSECWDEELEETKNCLFDESCWNYYNLYGAFQDWLAEHYTQWEIQAEQLLIYFIFTYFCGAVYDERIFAKVQMAVVSVYLIHDILLARWLKQGEIGLEDVVEIVYRYSRELEHSSENLELFEQMMEQEPLISKKREADSDRSV